MNIAMVGHPSWTSLYNFGGYWMYLDFHKILLSVVGCCLMLWDEVRIT